eukprot:354622-Chlamydomonas_euryale.AAC.5
MGATLSSWRPCAAKGTIPPGDDSKPMLRGWQRRAEPPDAASLPATFGNPQERRHSAKPQAFLGEQARPPATGGPACMRFW